MCDYSLELYRSVPAAVGESYKLVRFGTGSMGFAAGTSCDTAACVPAGAHLRLEGIDEALREDPVPSQVYGFTRLGHFELTRARRGPTLAGQLQALDHTQE